MGLRDRSGNLSGAVQALIFAGLTTALVVVFYVFHLRTALEDRENLRTEVAQLEVAVAQGKTVENRLSRFASELARLDERLEILRDSLPPEKETDVVLRSVQGMAAASNLKIIRLTPQPVVSRSFYSDWPLVMEVEGNYHALGIFFERISRLTRIININSVTIKGIDGSSDPFRTLSAVCTASTFVLKEAAPDLQ